MIVWQDDLNRIIVLPRAQQYAALQDLLARHDAAPAEEWNTTFGAASLYEALTQLPDFQRIYQANRAVVRTALATRADWHIVEIGGGNGALWRGFFRDDESGHFTLVDPAPEPHHVVAALLPAGVKFHSVVAPIAEADLPDADVVVCSLTLHHIAGVDAQERLQHGLTGPGKQEALERIVAALRPQRGSGILTEADTYHDLGLPAGDPLLVARFMDSYFRRGATMVAAALAQGDIDASLRQRWDIILRHWFLDQLDKAYVPVAERDVYELDAPSWLQVLRQAGAAVQSCRYIDDWQVFVQYVFAAGEGA
jgi:Methyltransferase domain